MDIEVDRLTAKNVMTKRGRMIGFLIWANRSRELDIAIVKIEVEKDLVEPRGLERLSA